MRSRPFLFTLLLAVLADDAGAQVSLSLTEAVRLALQRNPAIQLQQSQARASAGAATQARAPFDTVLSASVGAQRDQRLLRADEKQKYPAIGADQVVRSDNLQVGVARQLESGSQLTAAYTYNAAADNVQGAQSIPLQASDKLNFTLRLPLQRNLGQEAASALASADAEAQAAQLDSEHTVASTVLAVAQGYWEWAGRTASVEAALAAESRVARLVQETEKLVQMDELPPAEINLVRASWIERKTSRVAAEQRAVEARNTLGRLLGMNAEQARLLPVPSDPLPQSATAPPVLAALRAEALGLRRDLEAARRREGGAQARLDAARYSSRPQTDVVLSGYYAGLRESGRLAGSLPLTMQSSGPGVAAALVFQFPVENSAAVGLLDTAYANLDAARLRRASLEDSISVALEQTYAALMSVSSQLELSRDVVERYRVSVRNEETKRILGSATLIDVLNIEDRLNNALIARLQYQQAYVAAQAQLLFEAGRLVRADANGLYSVEFRGLQPEVAPSSGSVKQP